MKNKILFGTIILLLLIPLVSSTDLFTELNSVGRIVGESPNEYLKQLKSDKLEIKSSTIIKQTDLNIFDKKDDILRKQFEDVSDIDLADDIIVENQIYEMKNNELLIIIPNEDIFDNTFNDRLLTYNYDNNLTGPDILKLDKLSVEDVKEWQEAFERYNPLFLLDAPYAGSYLPRQDTYISRLTADSTIIAPMSFNSEDFTKSFICQLYNAKTIGEVFKDARNFHYNGGSKTSNNNLIGLLLQSYALYGDPTQKIYMKDYDKEEIKEWCKNYLENLDLGVEYLRQESGKSVFRKTLEFKIDKYNLTKIQNYTTIEIPGLFNKKDSYNIVEPISIRRTQFPKDSIFLDYRIEEISNPEDLYINLPEYLDFEYINRTCYITDKNTSVEFYETFQEDNHYFVAEILPLEIVDCSSGHFRLYKYFKYSVDYYTKSPVTIEKINYNKMTKPNSILKIDVETMSITTENRFGSIAIYDSENNLLSEKEIFSSENNHSLKLQTDKDEGIYKYSIEYREANETLIYREIEINNKYFEYNYKIPISFRNIDEIPIDFIYKYETKELNLSYKIQKNDLIIYQNRIDLIPTQETFTENLSIPRLDIENEPYELILRIETPKKSIKDYALLYTNNKPIIKIESPNYIYELQDYIIKYNIQDVDNDHITIDINDSNFKKINNTFVLKTNYDSQGNYSVKLRIDDTYNIEEKIINYEIKNYYRPMKLNLTFYDENNNLINEIENLEVYRNDIYYENYLINNSKTNFKLFPDNPNNLYEDGFLMKDNITFNIIGYDINKTYQWKNESIIADIIVKEKELTKDNLKININIDDNTDINDDLKVFLNIDNDYKRTDMFVIIDLFDSNKNRIEIIYDSLNVLYGNNNIYKNYNISSYELGEYYINYTIQKDNYSRSTFKKIKLYDSTISSPPVINSIELVGGYVGEYSKLVINASDINSDELEYYYNWPFRDNNKIQYFGITDIGIFKTNITVTDGIFNTTREFEFEILNKTLEKRKKGIILADDLSDDIANIEKIDILTKNNVIVKNISYRVGVLNE